MRFLTTRRSTLAAAALALPVAVLPAAGASAATGPALSAPSRVVIVTQQAGGSTVDFTIYGSGWARNAPIDIDSPQLTARCLMNNVDGTMVDTMADRAGRFQFQVHAENCLNGSVRLTATELSGGGNFRSRSITTRLVY